MTRPLRVLQIEDVESDALLVLRELRRGGFAVTAERVETPEALAAALTQPWDVVISDYSMPRFSAPLALQQVKEHGRDLPFIIVSGTVGEDIAVAAHFMLTQPRRTAVSLMRVETRLKHPD